MIYAEQNYYLLSTRHTSYAFHILPTGQPEHLYYGAMLHADDFASMQDWNALNQKSEYCGVNVITYDAEHRGVGLEELPLEFSTLGHGDIRTPLTAITWPDGSRSCDFLYHSHWILDRKSAPVSLPASYDTPDHPVQELHILFEDVRFHTQLEIIYAVFEDCDVIARRQILRNQGNAPIQIEHLLSLQLDLDDSEYILHTFTGHWAREMNRQDIPLRQGRFLSESRCGISSSMNNPFFLLGRSDAGERRGECMGFNLIYSGNHMECAEVNGFGKTRILTGIHPEGFGWELGCGESFESPEAIMTWSDDGYQGISLQMHHFVREHIIRGYWQHRERPILLNSWEAMYFDFNEDKLVDMAQKAAACGIELFVMDDGWFGHRDNAYSSLGDWYTDRKKLPLGIGHLAERIQSLGLKFGLWVEPEMISVDSDLYRAHPDWAVEIPGALHSEGRFQRILDLTRPEIQDWLIETMSEVFSTPGVTYVKWDNNRIFSDCFSRKLDRQTEFLHRYYLGYYRVMRELTEHFPEILFEGCASGGNRFDLGVLCYMPQIWASDNTDSICRTWIQTGLSYGYPMSVFGSHVSASPNHQTGRVSTWNSRFGVAAFGLLGYELNLSLLSEDELAEVRKQIAFYKKYRHTLQFGDYYRLVVHRRTDYERGVHQWMTVAPDKRTAVAFYIQEQTLPNVSFAKLITRGLDEDTIYHFTDWQASADPNVSDYGLEEDWHLSGRALNCAGIRLMQARSTPRGPANTRYFYDGASRIYVMETEQD